MSKFKLKNFISCPNCGAVTDINTEIFLSYFNSTNIICSYCREPFTLWKELFEIFERIPVSFCSHYSILGCEQKFAKIRLKSNELNTLDLSTEIGEGDLLFINYTGDNVEIQPVQLHSNTPMPHVMDKKIYLYGRPLNHNIGKVEESDVNVMYWFAPKELKEDLASMLLLDAFRFFYEKNYRYMVISAQSSAEILQYQFIEKALIYNTVSKKNTENFLKNSATYSYRLKVLLPFISEMIGFPKLNNDIYGGLEQLRKDRNALIHEGKMDHTDINRLKEELISVFLVNQYFKIYLDKIK